MLTNLTLKDLALVLIVVVIIGGFLFGSISSCDRYSECLETSIERPCIEGTVSYDSDDAECECHSQWGEIEWELGFGGGGCDLD